LPAIVLGLIVLAVLADRPEDARWLTSAERDWLARRMAGDRALRGMADHDRRDRFLRSRTLWLLCAVFFLNSIVNYGMFLWLPKLLADVTHLRGFSLSAITALPFVASLAAMAVVGRASDRAGERRRYVAGCALVTAAGLVVAVLFQRQMWLLILGFTIAQMALRSLAGVYWALPPARLDARSAAAGFGLSTAIGGL